MLDDLRYDASEGKFYGRRQRGPAPAGAEAGRVNSRGRRQVMLRGRRYLTSHLVWLMETGALPEGQLDHRDRDHSNNRFGNLRPATGAQNAQNKGPYRNNTSGHAGVSRHGSRWQAGIRIGGRRRHLGLFDTPDEAASAYASAKRELHPFYTED